MVVRPPHHVAMESLHISDKSAEDVVLSVQCVCVYVCMLVFGNTHTTMGIIKYTMITDVFQCFYAQPCFNNTCF
jgi:sugar phosphate permease